MFSEIKIHKSLSHNNIVKFLHSFEDPENVYLLLELCPNQTLNELLRRRKRLTEFEVLLVGRPPFETNDVKARYKRIKLNQYSFPDGTSISQNAKDLIKNKLVTEPEIRLTLEEILVHDFLLNQELLPTILLTSTTIPISFSSFQPLSSFNLPPFSFSNLPPASRRSIARNIKIQEIYVKKWVDYSSKYGFGYFLSNGSTGILFKDSTKIIFETSKT